MSNATLSPVSPCAMRYLNRLFVSSALPYPANIRIVHRRPRYIVGWIPRVNGYCPGRPTCVSGSTPARSSGVYSRSIGMNEVVANSFFRSGIAANESLSVVRSQVRFRSRSRLSRGAPMEVHRRMARHLINVNAAGLFLGRRLGSREPRPDRHLRELLERPLDVLPPPRARHQVRGLLVPPHRQDVGIP